MGGEGDMCICSMVSDICDLLSHNLLEIMGGWVADEGNCRGYICVPFVKKHNFLYAIPLMSGQGEVGRYGFLFSSISQQKVVVGHIQSGL